MSKVISSQIRLGNTVLAETVNLEQEADNPCGQQGQLIKRYSLRVYSCVYFWWMTQKRNETLS